MIAKIKSKKTSAESPTHINVEDIAPNPRQAREVFDKRELKRLAVSLKSGGLLQPIGVRPLPQDAEKKWELIWGERRLRAARLARKKTILARVCAVSGPDAMLMMGDENLNRTDWNPIEKAKYLHSLTVPESEGGAGMNMTQIAVRYRKSRPWVSGMIRLLSLPESWQEKITSGTLRGKRLAAIVKYADQPEVLTAIEAAMKREPWAWRTEEDVERNAELLVSGNHPSGLKQDRQELDTEHSQQAVEQGADNADKGPTLKLAERTLTVFADTAGVPDDGGERLPIEDRMTRLAESFPSLKGAPGVNPWDAKKLAGCAGPMSHGEQLAALFCLHVWDCSGSCAGQPFDLFRAVKVWDESHLDVLRAWLHHPFFA